MNETRRAVLERLADGPASGPDLADELDVSRAAVWKHVEALRAAGFEIASGEDGYALESVPEYGGAAVEYGLSAPFDVEFHEELASTNDRARELAARGAEDVVVIAERQTGGRGRLGREWASPPGGVWLSVVLRPALPPAHAPLLTLAAAVATARAAREAGVDAGIKWPNDVLVPTDDGERKLAGVLTEMEGEADRIEWLVVGVGVNVNVDAADLPEGATSVRERVGDVRRRDFVGRLLEAFHGLRSDPDAVLEAWEEHALTPGRRVRVETPTGTITGEARRVEHPGTLVIGTDDGGASDASGSPPGRGADDGEVREVRVHAGDCEHLRPVDE